MFYLNNKNKEGFTLIELLVVISIISLLSTVILTSLNVARGKARDTRRLSDMKQLQNALELYRNDHGSYPVSNCPWTANGWCAGCGDQNFGGILDVLVSGGYISKIPKDPNPNRPVICPNYEYTSGVANTWTCNGRAAVTYSYVIRFQAENPISNLPLFSPDPNRPNEYCLYVDK